MDAPGHCTCQSVRYRLLEAPLFVHACHCRWCQRETGSAFALNALIERSNVELTKGDVEEIVTPSESGNGQRIMRCPTCKVALWSHYAYGKLADVVAFVRVGTLVDPDQIPPSIHIFTASKVPWLQLADDTPIRSGYYKPSEFWPQESLDRRAALFADLESQS